MSEGATGAYAERDKLMEELAPKHSLRGKRAAAPAKVAKRLAARAFADAAPTTPKKAKAKAIVALPFSMSLKLSGMLGMHDVCSGGQ